LESLRVLKVSNNVRSQPSFFLGRPSLQLCIDALASLTTNAVPASASAAASALQAVSNPPYELAIETCGVDEDHLREMMNGPVQQVLAFANLDVDLGIRSTHGYKAMFKNNDYLDKIRKRLESMYQRKPALGLLPLKDVPLSPRFACVTADTKQRYQGLKLDFDPWEK